MHWIHITFKIFSRLQFANSQYFPVRCVDSPSSVPPLVDFESYGSALSSCLFFLLRHLQLQLQLRGLKFEL